MKRWFQSLLVTVVLRVVHAAIVELGTLDSRARQELLLLPEGMSYAVHASAGGPCLFVQWQGGSLRRLPQLEHASCALHMKSLPLAFQLLTGQIGLPQAYARHAFTLQGDVGDVMRLARLVNLVEAYLFPRVMTRRILTDIPRLQVNPLRVYGRLLCGFLTGRYESSLL